VEFRQVARETAPNLRVGFTVEPGRDFRILSSPDLVNWSSVTTNRTARRSFEWTQPASGAGGFYRVEQAFGPQ